jgi:hypothetical protein
MAQNKSALSGYVATHKEASLTLTEIFQASPKISYLKTTLL